MVATSERNGTIIRRLRGQAMEKSKKVRACESEAAFEQRSLFSRYEIQWVHLLIAASIDFQ
jgi:hypothetical protein